MQSHRKTYYVYIITNRSKTLYTGVTNNLESRMWEHKQGTGSEFASKYKIERLVCYESYDDVHDAIHREKQIKSLLHIKKITLIVPKNPAWRDLSEEWYKNVVSQHRGKTA